MMVLCMVMARWVFEDMDREDSMVTDLVQDLWVDTDRVIAEDLILLLEERGFWL